MAEAAAVARARDEALTEAAKIARDVMQTTTWAAQASVARRIAETIEKRRDQRD